MGWAPATTPPAGGTPHAGCKATGCEGMAPYARGSKGSPPANIWRHRRLQGIATPASGRPHATAIAGVAIVPHGRAHRIAIAGVPPTIAGTHAGVGARATVATATTRVAAGRAEHRVPHGLNAMLAQAGSRFFVFIHQQLTQQVAHVLHPQLAHFGRYASVS